MPNVVRLKTRYSKQRDAATVRAELERIRGLNGGVLKARTVWEQSRKRSAPLHNSFEWDDSIAGALYRDDQARALIATVEIVSETGPNARAYYHVTVDDDSGYMPAGEVVADVVLADQVLAEIRRDLSYARNRLAGFDEFSREVGTLDRVIAKVAAVNKAARCATGSRAGSKRARAAAR